MDWIRSIGSIQFSVIHVYVVCVYVVDVYPSYKFGKNEMLDIWNRYAISRLVSDPLLPKSAILGPVGMIRPQWIYDMTTIW